jgi:hypothetical protein
MEKKTFKQYFKEFTFEIVALLIGLILIIVFLADKDFSKGLITGFEFFRPEYAFTIFLVFSAISVVLGLLFFMQARKKKLKSTKKKSAFAATIGLSHKARAESVTQVVRTPSKMVVGKKNIMPKDIDRANPNVIDLYFDYDARLSI